MTLIDVKDKKILFQLDVNARQSNSEIAKKTRLGKDSVGYRIKRLEEKGIIRGYRAVVDSFKLGFIFYRVFFRLIDASPKRIDEMIAFLKAQKNAWWIARLDGSWDFAFAVWARSSKEFQKLYLSFCVDFRENIKDRLICPFISYSQIARRYLDEKQQPAEISIEESQKEEYDDIDVKILRFLAEDARTSLLKMAQSLKLDSMTIHHRIKRLEEKGIIKGYKVDLNFNILKKDFYSVKINLKSIQRLKEIKTYILAIKEVTAMTEAVGSYDVEFDLEVDSSEQYYEIIRALEMRFDFIREITYFRVLKNHKILYMPEM